MIAAERVVQPIAQLCSFDDVRPRPRLDLIRQQSSQRLDRKVLLLRLSNFSKEFIGQNRKVRLVETG